MRRIFLKQIFSRQEKFLMKRKLVLFWDIVLNSSQIFLQKGQENCSQWVYFSCFEKNILIFSWFEKKFLKSRKHFSPCFEGFAVPQCKCFLRSLLLFCANESHCFVRTSWKVHTDEHILQLTSVKIGQPKIASLESEVLFLSLCTDSRCWNVKI